MCLTALAVAAASRGKGRGKVGRSEKAQSRPCLRCCKMCLTFLSGGPPPALTIHQFENIIEWFFTLIL